MPILVYVTPWNSQGYDRTLAHAANLTLVSPTWHGIRPLPAAGSFEVTGQTDRNLTWLQAMVAKRSASGVGSGPKIVPRVSLDTGAWTQADFLALVHGQQGHAGEQFAAALVAACQALDYDGFVLEITPLLDYVGPLLLRTASAFNKLKLTLVLVAPPAPLPGDALAPRLPKGLDPAFVASLSGSPSPVAVSLMTYDYSLHRRQVGPNAPLDWVQYNLNRLCPPESLACSPPILMGIPFFGMRATFAPGSGGVPESFDPILGRDLPPAAHASALRHWDTHAQEHVITLDKGASKVWYPSRRSIRARMRLCRGKPGCGVAVWEGGQGTDELWEALFSL